ncbi:MAG: hypothetical protein JWL88_327 [Parcubacteria group bacterium]|nr:hypothetical protein [Parcubacteria group bacterium]
MLIRNERRPLADAFALDLADVCSLHLAVSLTGVDDFEFERVTDLKVVDTSVYEVSIVEEEILLHAVHLNEAEAIRVDTSDCSLLHVVVF